MGLNTINLSGTGWNKVGTALMTFRLASLSIFQTQNAPNKAPCGPKSGPNRLKIAFWPRKSAWGSILSLTGWNKVGTKQGHLVKHCWVFSCEYGKLAILLQKWQKKRLKTHKYDQIGHICLNTTTFCGTCWNKVGKALWSNNFGPFFMWKWCKNWLFDSKRGKKRPKYAKIRQNRLNRP